MPMTKLNLRTVTLVAVLATAVPAAYAQQPPDNGNLVVQR